LRQDPVIYMRWCNLIPKDYGAERFALSTPVWRPPGLSPYRKIAFQPNQLPSPGFWIAQGNHDLLDRKNGVSIGGREVDFPMLHVPIRSVDQFCLKLAQGIAAYSLRNLSSNKLEGFHWSNIYEVSRTSGLQPELLNWIAANYGQHLDAGLQRLSAADLVELGYTEGTLGAAGDPAFTGSAEIASTSETLYRVTAGFAADAARPRPAAAEPELILDEQGRIALRDRSGIPVYPSLPPRDWAGSQELAGSDDLAFLSGFLRPAVWPIKCLTPTAWGGHIPFMFCLVAALQPRRYVELGTHNGASFFAACQAAQRASPETQCVAVDLWTGDEHAGHYDETVFNNFSYLLNLHFKDVAGFIRDSFDAAAEQFAPESIDLLHIDGLHTYEAVKHDFDTWKHRVTRDGVIIFHDVNVHERDFGVWELWDELKTQYPAAEFFHSHGLGVLSLGDDNGNPVVRLIRLLQDDKVAAKFIQWFLQNVGELSVQRALLSDADQLRLRIGQLERELADEHARGERALQEIRSSTSWKLTAPLRVLTTWLRRMPRRV